MSILQDMIADAPAQVAATQKSIEQLQASIAVFQAKQDAMQTDIGNVVATDIEAYLIGTKFTPPEYYIVKGPNFNKILEASGSIVDWEIYKTNTFPLEPSLEYVYTPGDDTIIDDYKTNWDFAHDYIVKPVGLTGTYGTQDNIAKLTSSIGLLTSNKTKVNDSVAIFSQFVS